MDRFIEPLDIPLDVRVTGDAAKPPIVGADAASLEVARQGEQRLATDPLRGARREAGVCRSVYKKLTGEAALDFLKRRAGRLIDDDAL